MSTNAKTTDGIAFKSEHSVYSNLSPCCIEYEGFTYMSLEQALQHSRARSGENKKAAEKILAETDPYIIMKIGKGVTPSPEWNKKASSVVYELLKIKFSDETRKRTLTRSSGKHLYECTFHPIYGVGRHMGNVSSLTYDTVTGGNLLGKLLEKVRDEIIQQEKPKPPQSPPAGGPKPTPKKQSTPKQDASPESNRDETEGKGVGGHDDDDDDEEKSTRSTASDDSTLENKTMNEVIMSSPDSTA